MKNLNFYFCRIFSKSSELILMSYKMRGGVVMLKKSFQGAVPSLHTGTFVAETAILIGAVELAEDASVWYNCTVRADVNKIVIGKNTNIQDNSVVHCDYDFPTYIGENVTVGHRAVIHGCIIGDNCLIGMGAIIMDGAEIGNECIIGAGAVVSPGKKIPPRSLVMGVPGKVIKEVDENQIETIAKSAQTYIELAKAHILEKFIE